jgi:hypothetical protein
MRCSAARISESVGRFCLSFIDDCPHSKPRLGAIASDYTPNAPREHQALTFAPQSLGPFGSHRRESSD